jgi:hypothetical protein
MELNINNYEESFLLYADNELSVEDMKQVEDFVRNNPVLKEEFESILKTVLTSDTTIEFEDKSSLYKRASSFEARGHVENFVLYHDEELSKPEEQMIERLIRDEEQLKKEFDLIKRARFEADKTIIFPNKQLLYKKEKDDRIIPIWWRWAAAAILLGFGIWGGVKYFEHSAPSHELAKEIKALPPSNNLPTPINKGQVVNVQKPTLVNSSSNDNQDNPVVRVKHSDPSPRIVNKTNDGEQPDENVVIDLKNKESDLANTLKDLQKTVNDVVKNLDNLKNTKTEEQPTDQQYKVTNASYTQDNNTKSDDDYAFYNVPQRQFDKTKVGTLIKKTKRIVIRNLFHKKDKDSNE